MSQITHVQKLHQPFKINEIPPHDECTVANFPLGGSQFQF